MENRNKYLLTLVAYFKRFCNAIPVLSQYIETAAKEFVMKSLIHLRGA